MSGGTDENERGDGPRIAVVSGGSRGIGRATVLRLAEDGYAVAFCYQSDEDAAREVAQEASKFGGPVEAARVDVTDVAAVKAWLGRTEDLLGAPDVVVTSAGVTRDNPLLLMPDDDWKLVVDVNLGGVYNVCRAAVYPMMKRRRGSVVNISSVAGVYGNATQTNYSASKAGIIGFTRALAKEIGRYGIRVNAVAPGFIDTDMTSAMAEPAREKALQAIPLRRMGRADEVADLVAYLADDRSAYITGAVLQIDGGITI